MVTVSRSQAGTSTYGAEIAGAGWIAFAGILLVLAGFFNVIDGIAAVSRSDYLTNQLLFANLDAWGWFFIIWGALQVIAGVAVFGGSTWAAVFGIISAFVNAVAQLSWAATYPVWAISVMVLDVLVIYALVVYGGQRD
jgi:hypothetical protein